MQITIIVLTSATGYMVIDGIYNSLLPLPIPLPSVKHLAGHGSLHGGVTQIFIPERSEPSAVLLVLSCCLLI